MKKFSFVLTLLLVLMLSSCNTDKDAIKKTPPQDREVVSQKQEPKICEYVLYYPDSQAQSMHPVVREATQENTKDEEFILRELLKTQGSNDGKFINVIPPDTLVNSCSTKDGVCTVDFSGAFLSVKGTATQKMAIYSVVNTLCNLDKIDSVQFLIDGEKREIFGGLIFDEPFEADLTIIAE